MYFHSLCVESRLFIIKGNVAAIVSFHHLFVQCIPFSITQYNLAGMIETKNYYSVHTFRLHDDWSIWPQISCGQFCYIIASNSVSFGGVDIDSLRNGQLFAFIQFQRPLEISCRWLNDLLQMCCDNIYGMYLV